jgi:membrane-associated protease RseP (regulator of RpoE activity)
MAMRRIFARNLGIAIGCGAACCVLCGEWASAQPLPFPADDSHLAQDAALALPEPPGHTAASPREIDRAYLGVTFDPQVRDAAVVQSVAPDSPAEHAGLKPGDSLQAINGNPVSTYDDVIQAIHWMKPGDSLDIDVSRRVSIRTKAVLERAVSSAEQVTGFAPGQTAISNSDARRSPFVEEQLPTPVSYQERRRVPTQQYRARRMPSEARGFDNSAAGRRYPDDRGRRRATFDRGYRDRGLFPWRRN